MDCLLLLNAKSCPSLGDTDIFYSIRCCAKIVLCKSLFDVERRRVPVSAKYSVSKIILIFCRKRKCLISAFTFSDFQALSFRRQACYPFCRISIRRGTPFFHGLHYRICSVCHANKCITCQTTGITVAHPASTTTAPMRIVLMLDVLVAAYPKMCSSSPLFTEMSVDVPQFPPEPVAV